MVEDIEQSPFGYKKHFELSEILLGVKEGRFPKPRKMGRMSIWRLADIKLLAESARLVDD